MQISLWSNMHGQAAVSATTAALACTIAQNTAFKTLVAQNHLERSALETYLFRGSTRSDRTVKSVTNYGIDALLRLIRNGRLTPDMVPDYAYSILKNHRLDIMPGSLKKDKRSPGDYELMFRIVECARQFYDIVLIDVHSGLEHNNCMDILKSSDIIVFCINQNVFLLNDLMKSIQKYDFLQNAKSAFVISRYEKGSGLSALNLTRRFKLLKNSVFYVPNSADFADALNSGRVFEYIAFNQNSKKYEEKMITQSFNRLCDYLVEGCRVNAGIN